MGISELLVARKKLSQFNKSLAEFDSDLHPVKQAHGVEIDEARRFLAATYTRREIADSTMVDEETGLFRSGIEIGLDRSDFFGTESVDGRFSYEVVSRLIHTSPEGGVDSLQMHIDELPEFWRNFVRQLPQGKTVEAASLAKAPGVGMPTVINQVREMVYFSLGHGVEYWLWGMEEPIAAAYGRVFGDAITPMGPAIGFGNFNFKHVPQFVDLKQAMERFRNPTLRDRALGRAGLYEFMSQNHA